MGLEAGVTVYFYKGDKLINIDYMSCYKFQYSRQFFDVSKFDKIELKFSTEHDSSSEQELDSDNSDE